MKAVSFIGNNSLAFYFLCGGVPIVICNIAKIIIPINTINMLLLCALCIASVYAIVYVLNRWFPWLFDLRILVSNKIK